MNITTFPAGNYGANTYLVENEQTHECLVVDPGGSFDLLRKMAEKYKIIPKHLLLTHGHFDHIGALEEVRDYYRADVYAHAECSRAIFDPLLNLSAYGVMNPDGQIKCEPAENILTDGQDIELCGFKLKAIHVPGHSKGSMVFVIEKCAFTGDVLFKMSMGRTDLLGGDAAAMDESLKKLKKLLAPDIKILPGHGEESMMAYELEHNPFLRSL